MSMIESNQDDYQGVKAEKKINISKWNEYEDKTILELLKSTQGSEMIEDEESSVLKTPSSKHMQEERDEVPDLTSTSKKLCSKAVKMEKLDEEEIKNKKNN
ncbi:hypothetical protein Bca52824_016131 [Brassica carinata]|uniref:Uncharacterized protein n=1 Tax=Brassica carinata TaxID=52824 RepID=A0A8X7W6F6_BRACI|nr:hypothetical protein Bca52824_016131 [Brassica carinata]